MTQVAILKDTKDQVSTAEVVLTNLGRLATGTASKEEEKLFIDKVLRQTNRMNDIIDDLLKLSRIEFQEEGDSIMLVKTPAISIIDGAIDDVRSFLEKENKQIEVLYRDYPIFYTRNRNMVR